MTATVQARRYAYSNEGCLSIISYLVQTNVNKKGSTAPFINNLEIVEIFKDKAGEEEASVIDLIK